MAMTFEIRCRHCQAKLTVEATLETNETLAYIEPEDVVVLCPACGRRLDITLDSGVESVEVRLKPGQEES